MHTITRLRLYLSKSKKDLLLLFLGLLLGVVIIPLATGITFLFGLFSQAILITACSLLSVIVLALTAYLIILKNKINSREKIIKELDPNLDIRAREEYSLGWDEATKNDKKQ